MAVRNSQLITPMPLIAIKPRIRNNKATTTRLINPKIENAAFCMIRFLVIISLKRFDNVTPFHKFYGKINDEGEQEEDDPEGKECLEMKSSKGSFSEFCCN